MNELLKCREKLPLRLPIAHLLLPYLAGLLWFYGQISTALGLFFLLIFHQGIYLHRPLLLISTLLLGLTGHFYATCRQPAPLPRSQLYGEIALQLKLHHGQRRICKDHWQFSGFGKILTAGGQSEGKNNPIYFTVRLPMTFPVPRIGQILDIRGRIRRINRSFNSFENYLRNSGTPYILQRGIIENIHPGNAFTEFLGNLQIRSQSILSRGFSENSSIHRLYRAMILGNRSGISPDQKKVYSRTGIAHLFAISGLHIGVIGGFLAFLTRGIHWNRVGINLLNLLILFIFVQMIGASPSAMRAFFMIGCLWVAPLLYRRSQALASLTLAAFLTLIFNPADILNTGFQLSYGIVFALLIYGVPLGNYWRYRIFQRENDPYGTPKIPTSWRRGIVSIGQLVALSISATLPMIPLSIYHFDAFSLGSVLLNPIVIPASAIPITCGFASLLGGFLHVPLVSFLANRLAAAVIYPMDWLARHFSTFHWVQSENWHGSTTFISLWLLILFTVLLYSHSLRRAPIKFLLPLPVVLLPLWGLWLSN